MHTELPTIYKVHNKQINIALTGKMRSGKDTVARAIASYSRSQSKFYSFGHEIKVVAEKLFPEEFKNGTKPRNLYQWLGQTLRSRNENVWVNATAKEMNDYMRIFSFQNTGILPLNNIITDLRQPNEYEFCKKNNFYIIKTQCDDNVRLERMKQLNDNFTLEDLSHETEGYIDSLEHDYLIDTTHTTEEDIALKVKEIIQDIEYRQTRKVVK